MTTTRSTVSILIGSAALLVLGGAVLGFFDKSASDTSASVGATVETSPLDEVGVSALAEGMDLAPVSRESGNMDSNNPVATAPEPARVAGDAVGAVYAPTNEEAIEKYGSVTSWQLHLLESEDQDAFRDWIDLQFEDGLADAEKSFENVQMISDFLAQAVDQGYTGQPLVECSAMICRLEFDGASDFRALTRMIGQDLVALPEDIAGFHGMRRGPNRELIIFAPLKGILGTEL